MTLNEALDIDPKMVFIFLKERSFFDTVRFEQAWQTLKSAVLSQPAHNNARDEICADILEYKRAYQMRLDLGSRFDDIAFINGILDIVKRKLSPIA